MRLATVVLAVVLSGCATPYGPIGWTGGVEAQRISSSTWRIVARANSYTSRTRIADFTLLKAAETTLEAGGTHFILSDQRDASSVSYSVDRWSVDRHVAPGSDTYMHLLRISPGQTAPPGAFEAREIDQIVGARIRPRQS